MMINISSSSPAPGMLPWCAAQVEDELAELEKDF
eukprot:COSAG01_NODE_45875_length_405_cov_1.189542_1_plen_33_part_10